jgi:hypothetical protein
MALKKDTMLADPWGVTNDDGATVFPVIMRAVIGEVTVDHRHDGPPAHVVAFEMIARNDTPGSYEFPMADGRTCHVDVAYEGPDLDAQVAYGLATRKV